MMNPSPFQYAIVSSGSGLNSASSFYTFTLTLSVDTDANSVIMINLPPEIVFDSFQPLTCKGLLNLATTKLRCTNKNSRQFLVYVWGDQLGTAMIANGTTVSF